MSARGSAARVVAVLGLLVTHDAALAAADCSASPTGVAFGTYDPLAPAPDDSTGSVTVTCNYVAPGGASDAAYALVFSTGLSGAYAQRQLAAGTSRLAYNLFNDAARTRILGNLSAGTTIMVGALRVGPGVGNGSRSNTHTVYGRMPALQNADTGTYADSIVVTLIF